MGAKLNEETMKAIRYARPMVDAINALMKSYEEATDVLLEETDDEEGFDDHPFDPMRDLAHDTVENLIEKLDQFLSDYEIKVKFNRIEGAYYLVEKN